MIEINIYAELGLHSFLVNKSLDDIRNMIINKDATDEKDKDILRIITDKIGFNYGVDHNILHTPVEKSHMDIILFDGLQLAMLIEYQRLK